MSHINSKLQRLERLQKFSHELTSTVSVEPLLHKIVQVAVELTESEMAGLLLLDEGTSQLRFLVTSSFTDQLINIPVPIEESIAGAAFSSGEPVIVANVRRDPRYYRKIEQIIGVKAYSLLAVPLQFRERRIGVLEIENKIDGGQFNPEDIETLTTLAAHATIAIENARLIEAQEEARSALERRVRERTAELATANTNLKSEVGERIRAEERLRQHTGELEARNEELAAFAQTVAHDLRNPLSTIIGYAEVLSESRSDLSEQQLQELLETIARFARKMDTIIDELMLLAGVREMEVRPAPLNMAPIVAEAQIRLTNMIEEYGAEITLPEQWPEAVGYGPWIEEVWVNYLSNALKYGGVPPRVTLGATLQDEGQICYWIRDNGPGVPLEEQPNLFTPFKQLTQVQGQGHGLGLSIVRRIIERLGGNVGVANNEPPLPGSTFFFTLPGI